MPSRRIEPKASGLGRCPVDAGAFVDHRLAVFQEALDRAVRLEILRGFGQFFADFLERLDWNRSLATALLVGVIGLLQARTRHRPASRALLGL